MDWKACRLPLSNWEGGEKQPLVASCTARETVKIWRGRQCCGISHYERSPLCLFITIFWRERQKMVSGKEQYYTGDKKYCKALGRQRKHLVTSEELHGYNLGQSLALTASICISFHDVQYTKWRSHLHGCKSRVSLPKTTVLKPMEVTQIDVGVNEITLWP